MLRNYLKIAFRNLWKNRTYSFINILGLTLGLASFLLIALYVFDELTYDRFHKNANNIYRVIEEKTTAEGKESRVAAVAYKISEQSPLQIPEVKKSARLSIFGRSNISDPANINTFYELYYLASQDFLDIFDFKFIEGNRDKALVAPRSAIITEELAKKIYGVSSVVGKSLQTDRDSLPYTITGVLENFPSNSHISFNFLVSESTLSGENYLNFIGSDWTSNTFLTYLLLDPHAEESNATQKLNKLVASNRTGDQPAKTEFSLQPLTDVHFHSANIEGTPAEKKGNLSYIYVFSIVAVFVLLIACINYMNLTTARFSSRGKEIAVRKVSGALRKNLVSQFLSEAMVMAVISLVLALAITMWVLPWFNSFSEKQLSLGLGTDYRIWIGILATVIVVGLFAGTYPAVFQSGLRPFQLLKNKITQSKSQLSLRKGLVVFQFALSIIMIVATIVVFLQMKYVDKADMGFNKEQLLVVDINSGNVRRGAATIKAEYQKIAAVKSVSVTSRVPGEWKVIPKVKAKPQGSAMEAPDIFFMATDEEFLNTFEISLAKGRNLTEAISDSSSVMLNETAAAQFGIIEPSGQLLEIPSYAFSGNATTLAQPFVARVVGITRDFNFRSMREKITPLIMAHPANPVHSIDYFTVKLTTNQVDQTLAQLEAAMHKIDPNHLFEYNFLDKQWDVFYREDQKRQTIFLAIAIMTILIACLGLFGLTTYAAEQRVKEIGIRKVLGASVTQLIAMLSKEFLKLVFIAAIIAVPVAWWMMNSWLNDFAYRTRIYWWVFLVAGLIALFIALFTVGLKSLKAALINPVKSLRSE